MQPAITHLFPAVQAAERDGNALSPRSKASTAGRPGASNALVSPLLPDETLEEIVHNIAQINHMAQWFSALGSHTDTIAATESAGRLSEALGEHMCARGIRTIETPTHRATLTSYEHKGERKHSVLVVERRAPAERADVPSVPPAPTPATSAFERGDRRLTLPAKHSAGASGEKSPAWRQTDIEAPPTEPPLPPGGLPEAPPSQEEPPHGRLCPLGGAATRWYVCTLHEPRVIFQAGSGFYDSIANSCPRCGRLARDHTGCACEEAARPVDRRRRRRRRVRVTEEARGLLPAPAGEDNGTGEAST